MCQASDFSLPSHRPLDRSSGRSANLTRTNAASLLGKTKDVDRYSWHQCIGGSEYDNSGNWIGTYAAMQRKCHFKNVCVRLLPYANDAQGPPNDRMNNETIEMTYFQPPALIGGPRIWSTSQNDGDAWLKTDRDHFLRKVNAYEPMPTDVRYVTEPTVVSGSFWVRFLPPLTFS